MFETIGPLELIVVALIGLLVFGPQQLGKYIRMADEIRRWFKR